jgi:hypothetical protein
MAGDIDARRSNPRRRVLNMLKSLSQLCKVPGAPVVVGPLVVAQLANPDRYACRRSNRASSTRAFRMTLS